jgi:hypothetical protein
MACAASRVPNRGAVEDADGRNALPDGVSDVRSEREAARFTFSTTRTWTRVAMTTTASASPLAARQCRWHRLHAHTTRHAWTHLAGTHFHAVVPVPPLIDTTSPRSSAMTSMPFCVIRRSGVSWCFGWRAQRGGGQQRARRADRGVLDERAALLRRAGGAVRCITVHQSQGARWWRAGHATGEQRGEAPRRRGRQRRPQQL